MAGEIRHEWDGSILTVTSDAGTSAADLKGPKGDVGPRGPQGPAGVIYDADGKISIDLSPYATQETVNAAIANIDLDNYATHAYVSNEIAKAQLAEVVGDVDLSGFATKDDIANIDMKVDNKTIIKGADGSIHTAIGGYNTGGGVDYENNTLYYVPTGRWGGNGWVYADEAGNIGRPFVINTPYQITLTFADGYSISFEMMYGSMRSDGRLVAAPEYENFEMTLSMTNEHFSGFNAESNGNFSIETANGAGTVLEDKYILTSASIYAPGFVPIDAKFVPVDGNTIYVNGDGNLACSVSIGAGGSINLDNYYTKAEIDALLSSGVGNYPSSEEVEY